MMRAPRTLLAAASLAAMAAVVLGHVRLVHPNNGKFLRWANPGNIGIVINSAGSDDLPDGSHETALRMAIEDWNAVTGTSATLVEDTSPAAQARTNWGRSNIHLILFDEDNSSGYFPLGSGTVAITPVWFEGGGQIVDSDILFNGMGYSFTTSQQIGRFDVQDVGAHELGHLIGLDHSGWAGATMYPYVDPTIILHRSLSMDEVRGLRHAYPNGSFGQITGTVRRLSNGQTVSGAHVVAQNSATGRTAAGILTKGNGTFTLRGLEPGNYIVYATPLDAPVSEANLGQGYSGDIETNFEPRIYAQQAMITGSEVFDLGNLNVDDDVILNLGKSSDRYPIRIVEGASRTVTLRGTGLLNPATLTASDTDLIIGTPMWFGSQVSFQVTVPDGEAPGHVDLMVTNAFGDTTILPAALEVTPPSPAVTNVVPGLGGISGGTAVMITGAGFNPGARIVIGDRIYTDGLGGTMVMSPTTISLTTEATMAGLHDVVVIDATGVEGRMSGAFQAASVPVVTSIFPGSGDSLGGTEVALAGQDFLPGAVVRINGVDQGPVTFESASVLRFTTTAGSAGPQVLEVENPGGWLANSAFTYVAAPDPLVAMVTPNKGKKGGGKTVTVMGANFSAASEVFFGVDPATGMGGVAATSVTFLNASTLEVVTPSFSTKGPVAVVVCEPATSQAGVLNPGFTYQKSSSGGGGSCAMVPVHEPPRPRPILLGTWWIVLLFLVVGVRARRARFELKRT